MDWVFRWCTKKAIFYQRQGHWMTAASPSEWVTQCHSNPGVSSDCYQIVKYLVAKHPDLTQFLRKYISLTGKLLTLIQLILVKELTALSLTSEGFKQRTRWRLISSTSFCSPTTVIWTLLQKPTFKTVLKISQWPVTILAYHQHKKRQNGKPYVEPNIKGQRLKAIEKFTYFGSTLFIVMDDDVNIRLAKSSAAFGRLKRNEWNRRGISEATKIKVYQAVVLTTFLYGCETLTTYQRHIKNLNHFHTSCLRKIIGSTLQKNIPDTEVLTRATLPIIFTILTQS